MKRIALILFAVVAVALLGWRLASPGDRSTPSVSSVQSVPPSTTQTDPREVFQRAFWRRPTEADEILHAERREWKDAEAITRWQWFIKVNPSPELVKHLITDNAFNLAAASAPAPVENAPAWFDATGKAAQVLQSLDAHMQIIFDPQSNLLIATDTGGGFRQGAPEPAKPVAQNNAASSRLPNSPPPKP